jgi:hypothetical protein
MSAPGRTGVGLLGIITCPAPLLGLSHAGDGHELRPGITRQTQLGGHREG